MEPKFWDLTPPRGRVCVFTVLMTWLAFPSRADGRQCPLALRERRVCFPVFSRSECPPRFESEKMETEIHSHLAHVSFSVHETGFDSTYLKAFSVYFSVNYLLLLRSFAHFSDCLLVLFFLIFMLGRLDPCLFWLFVLEEFILFALVVSCNGYLGKQSLSCGSTLRSFISWNV